MDKLDCIQIEGLRLWFNSNDHLPPHLHATKIGEWEIRIYFLRCTQSRLDFDKKWGHQPPRRLLDELLKIVLEAHELI